MKINNQEVDVNKAVNFANYEGLLLKRRENEMLLSDYQVSVLKINGIDYKKYGNMQELLFDIEELLNDDYDEELEGVSKQLAELIYYRDTKK